MAELNELLDEAASEAGSLSEEADGASDSVEALLAKANALEQQVTARGEEARRALESLKDALHEAEESVTAARGRSDAGLADLGTRATELRGEVTNLLEAVKRSLDELETQKARLVEDADAQAHAVEGALSELSNHAGDAAEAIEQQLTGAMAAITAFRGAVETARVEFVGRHTAFEEAANELEAQATEQALVFVDGMQHLLADQATAMVEMTNGIVETHNAVMENLKERFAVEAREAVAGSLAALAEELTNLAHNAAEEQGTLTAKSDEVLERVRSAVPVIEQLASALDSAAGRL
jgi:ABC-type transporter Mla subunit MlaD